MRFFVMLVIAWTIMWLQKFTGIEYDMELGMGPYLIALGLILAQDIKDLFR